MKAEDDLITIRNWDMCHYCCITAPPADPGNSCHHVSVTHAFLRRPRALCSRCSVWGMRFLNLRIHGACALCEKTSSHFIISHIPLRISSALAPCFFCNDLTVAAGIILGGGILQASSCSLLWAPATPLPSCFVPVGVSVLPWLETTLLARMCALT